MKLVAPLILGSGSPRRKEILTNAGFEFQVKSSKADESVPDSIPVSKVAAHLAIVKSNFFRHDLEENIVVTADTIVSFKGQIINKPDNKDEAIKYLQLLSGNEHKVITGFSIRYKNRQIVDSNTTRVSFRDLDRSEIEYYVSNYKVSDKAGAYGIQDWIGLIGITKIEGSFYNVMGLPMHNIYSYLKKEFSKDN